MATYASQPNQKKKQQQSAGAKLCAGILRSELFLSSCLQLQNDLRLDKPSADALTSARYFHGLPLVLQHTKGDKNDQR